MYFRLVCADCAMFETHQKHDIYPPERAIETIRDQFDAAIKKGHLKAAATEDSIHQDVLVDINGALNQCKKQRTKILRDADNSIKDLSSNLKARKHDILDKISTQFEEERQKIKAEEVEWKEKDTITKELLQLYNDKNSDEQILMNAKFISEGMKKISEPLKFTDFKLINKLDTVMHVKDNETGVDKVDLSYDQLKELFSKYLNASETNKIQYKA